MFGKFKEYFHKKEIHDYSKALSNEQWSEHYNMESLNYVCNAIRNGEVQVWAKELCNIIDENSKVLEIGCGTGISSLWLAKNNRQVTALDYTESSVQLVSTAAKMLDLPIETVRADATKKLPFKDKQFDVIFQSGLLEHFSTDEQIKLLTNWKNNCKIMISMIPNASSIPYRLGKEFMEKNGTWSYGLEVPKHSLAMEFENAGIHVIREYTIGTEWAMKFLPEKHELKKYYERLIKSGINLDSMNQGYLLVTIGSC